MAKLIFNLRDVPEQEANDIRDLLEENNIEYYETDEGRWRISVAAIWVTHNADFTQARELINQYQLNLMQKRQKEGGQASGSGLNNWLKHVWSHPIEVLMFTGAIIVVLALSLLPFFRLS